MATSYEETADKAPAAKPAAQAVENEQAPIAQHVEAARSGSSIPSSTAAVPNEREVIPCVSTDSPAPPSDERKFTPLLPPVDVPRTFHDEAGYNLTRWVLIGLFVAIMTVLLLSAFLPPSYHDETARATASKLLIDCLTADAAACPSAKLELAKTIAGDPIAHREFWKTMFDKVVGATLFPILTALLGYLFGAQGRSFLAQQRKTEET